jgi:hypothetical protein
MTSSRLDQDVGFVPTPDTQTGLGCWILHRHMRGAT